jgi:hypothetical protein
MATEKESSTVLVCAGHVRDTVTIVGLPPLVHLQKCPASWVTSQELEGQLFWGAEAMKGEKEHSILSFLCIFLDTQISNGCHCLISFLVETGCVCAIVTDELNLQRVSYAKK